MAAKEIIDTIAEALAEAWGTLFMKQIGLSAEGIEGPEQASEVEPGDYVVGAVTFSGDVNGETKYYIPKTEALTMVGMMMSMGADDSLIDSTRDGDLGADELDALNEAFNQLSATAATVIREKMDCNVTGSTKPTEKLSIESGLPDVNEDDLSVKLTLNLEGYEDGIIVQILSKELHSSLEGGEEAASDEDDLLAMLEDSDDAEPESQDSDSEAAAESPSTATSPPAEEAPADPLIELLQAKGQLKVKADVVLAERSMEVNQLLGMSIGSVIEFWKPCDDPAEMNLGNSPVASGEVVVSSDQHFCIRVTEIAPPKKTYQKGLS